VVPAGGGRRRGPEAALTLLEQHVTAAHGYATLHDGGLFRRRSLREGIEGTADLAVAASRALVRGAPGSPSSGGPAAASGEPAPGEPAAPSGEPSPAAPRP
jgi:hypothetical protein